MQCHCKPCIFIISSYCIHCVLQMMLYALDRELFQAFSIIYFPISLVKFENWDRNCCILVKCNLACLGIWTVCTLWWILCICFREIFTWQCCKSVFFTTEKILESCTSVVFCGRSGIFMFTSVFFILRLHGNCYSGLCLFHSHRYLPSDHMMWFHSNSFLMQMSHLESTFTCLFHKEIM